MDLQDITQNSLPDLQKGQGHKYNHGHAVVVSGGPGKTGAARLAARGALRIGAGLVTLACPMRVVPEIAAQVTAIMIHSIDGPTGLAELLEDGRIKAVCLGPALGLTQITADLVRVVLESKRAVVLDADALGRFERAPAALFQQLHADAVLTPHEGEFRRLFPDLAADPDRVRATQAAAQQAGAVVLRKGVQTVIATPEGQVFVHEAVGDRATPWLATAGAGDVLAGMIAGLMARGFGSVEAACAATWLHVEAAAQFGPGLIAEDLPELLPGVLADLKG